jgi:hypothetical protein
MKVSCFSVLFILCMTAPWLEAGQMRDKKHGHMHGRPHYKQHLSERTHRERKNILFENFNKEQQAVYNEMHDLQRIIRKNMFALGQERRNIKNITTSDARKALQANINKICNEIKRNIEEHQPRIIDAIDTLP